MAGEFKKGRRGGIKPLRSKLLSLIDDLREIGMSEEDIRGIAQLGRGDDDDRGDASRLTKILEMHLPTLAKAFKLLKKLGNPSDLSSPEVIKRFRELINSDDYIDTSVLQKQTGKKKVGKKAKNEVLTGERNVAKQKVDIYRYAKYITDEVNKARSNVIYLPRTSEEETEGTDEKKSPRSNRKSPKSSKKSPKSPKTNKKKPVEEDEESGSEEESEQEEETPVKKKSKKVTEEEETES
jgi:hypothetical protein